MGIVINNELSMRVERKSNDKYEISFPVSNGWYLKHEVDDTEDIAAAESCRRGRI